MTDKLTEIKKELVKKATLIEAVIQLNQNGKRLFAFNVAREYKKITNELIDWHEASNILSYLKFKSVLTFVNVNEHGQDEYKVAEV